MPHELPPAVPGEAAVIDRVPTRMFGFSLKVLAAIVEDGQADHASQQAAWAEMRRRAQVTALPPPR